VITAATALYFNVFVFVVQSFEKVPALRALAPTQKEPPFGITQLLVLILFVTATVYAVKRFQPGSLASSSETVPEKRAA
jgi:flagellar biogenesis protein FliO